MCVVAGWGGVGLGAGRCTRAHGGLMSMCGCIIFCTPEMLCIFLYIKPRMASYYIILCVYQSLIKLLDCEIKNQVKYMCSFKNHIHKNTSQFERLGDKNRISFRLCGYEAKKLYFQRENQMSLWKGHELSNYFSSALIIIIFIDKIFLTQQSICIFVRKCPPSILNPTYF